MMLFSLDLKDALAIISVIFLCSWGLATLLFGRISLKYLDSALAKQGIAPPLWDVIGIRLNLYSFALISSWFARSPLIPGDAIRQIARPKDGYLALFYNISAWFFFISALCFYFVPDA